jgi:hypothetical protein
MAIPRPDAASRFRVLSTITVSVLVTFFLAEWKQEMMNHTKVLRTPPWRTLAFLGFISAVLMALELQNIYQQERLKAAGHKMNAHNMTSK